MGNYGGKNPLIVTAFVGGENGHGVAFQIGNEVCELAENQVKDLIKILQKRLKCVKGWSATDTLSYNISDKIVLPQKASSR